ncbi:MAG: GNAT family N-acetyltransferase [Phycisphaerales bacterium]
MPEPQPVSTPRLLLRPFTRAELEADLQGRAALEQALAPARPAPDWPNQHWDHSAVRWLLDKLDNHPDEPLWRAWLILLKDGPRLTAVGTMGFKGPPGPDGLVEVGYGVVTSLWRRGIASEALAGLIHWARSDQRVRGVCAHTRPADPASGGVLLKNSLTHAGLVNDAEDGDIERYERWFAPPPRRDYAACEARVHSLLPRAAQHTLRQRQEAVTRAYWECFGSTDPAGDGELSAGRAVSWCGFYDIAPGAPPDAMLLVCREPKPACSPIGLHGMCGRGWKEQRGFVVRDVKVLGQSYVACDPRDQSELVLPVFSGAACTGVFDVDSYHAGAFTLGDLQGTRRVLDAAGLTKEKGPAPTLL